MNYCEIIIFDAGRSDDQNPSEIDTFILTHAHPDLIGAAFLWF